MIIQIGIYGDYYGFTMDYIHGKQLYFAIIFLVKKKKKNK